MRSRTTALATVTILCAALYGCSSSAQQNGSISGAASVAATGSATSAPSASTVPVAGLSMKFDIPADLNLEFETAELGSPTADQIETILVDQYESYIEALSSTESTEANYKSLTVGDALRTENSELDWWKQRDERLTGVDRVYQFRVTVNSANGAAYSYCEDSRQLDYRNLSSGKTIANTAGTMGNYTLREGFLVRGKGELWAVQTILTQNGAASCNGN